MPDRYPLSWPLGVPRTTNPGWSKFDRTRSMEKARKELMSELSILGAKDIIISTNIELRQDGFPYSNRRQPTDKGVAVYFKWQGRDYCFPCDKWDRIECNIYAIAMHINAMRGQMRWGVGSVEQQFRGYQALPAPTPLKPWWEVFGFSSRSMFPPNRLKELYNVLAKANHPDNGGNHDRMAELNRAYAEAKKELGL